MNWNRGLESKISINRTKTLSQHKIDTHALQFDVTKTYLILCGWCAWCTWSWMITASNNTSSLHQNILTVRRWACASTCDTACTAAIRIITAIQNMLICGLLLLFLNWKQKKRKRNSTLFNIETIDLYNKLNHHNSAKFDAMKCILIDGIRYINWFVYLLLLLLILLSKHMTH